MTVLEISLGYLSLFSQLGLVVVLNFVHDQVFGLFDVDLWFIVLPLVTIRRPLTNIPFQGQALAIYIFELSYFALHNVGLFFMSSLELFKCLREFLANLQ